ncbi:GNAT family N-acetyltransferase [Alteromonas aestuariivivens]|uniref:GNAT family N-acetyltransferase n=1 Tax=Alteromonas aestuariivivens TaxID=1938339 RepID=A0A3D8M2Z3_9ALTE|nr:GNAT family N-acetyltransferase [Alteromonas aestuariivivens]RDV24011.1 GNAT family N-acetyltransferase [Alteromonas aestuariivivens]
MKKTWLQNNVMDAATVIKNFLDHPSLRAQKISQHAQLNQIQDQEIDALAPTIFHERWWLEIATGGKYQAVDFVENGKVFGRLPYFTRKQFGFTEVKQAPLTNFLGPAINDGEGKPNKKFLRRLQIVQGLIAQLPKASSIYIKCHRDVMDAVAFQAAGFKVSVQFTHVIEPAPVDELWGSMRSKVRSSIRGARRNYRVADCTDSAAFLNFYNQNIEKRQLQNMMNGKVCKKLIDAALEKGRGRVLQSIHKDTGKMDAAIFYVWDKTSAYFLMTTHNARASHRGVLKILIWEAIQDAVSRGLVFDFDGVSSIGCARSANDFTAEVVPRYIITRESGPIQILRAVESLWVKQNTFY